MLVNASPPGLPAHAPPSSVLARDSAEIPGWGWGRSAVCPNAQGPLSGGVLGPPPRLSAVSALEPTEEVCSSPQTASSLGPSLRNGRAGDGGRSTEPGLCHW